MDDVPSSDDFDLVQNAKNTLTIFKAPPSNFSKVTKKKGRPKTEKRLKFSVEIV